VTTPADSTKAPRKRRWWLSYSLRGLLVLVTLFGIWLGIKVDQARRQKRAVETLLALGGKVAYEHQRTKSGFDMEIELNVPMWARELCGDDFFQTVRYVVFMPQWDAKGVEMLPHRVTDDDLECLAELPHIERLEAWKARISAAGLEHLRHPQRLRVLRLGDTNVGNDFVRRLKGARNLESLELSNSPVTDDGFAEWEDMTKVFALTLNGTRTGDRALAAFAECTQLVGLQVGSATTDEGIRQFRSLETLEWFKARDCAITGDAFRGHTLPKIDSIQLENCRVADADLAILVQAGPDVRALALSGSPITDAGLAHFAKLGKTQILVLRRTKIKGSELGHLASLPAIQFISLVGCPLDDPDLKGLEPLYSGTAPGPHILFLDKTPINDDDLAKISGFTNLTYLGLSHTNITDAGLPHLYNLAKSVAIDLRKTKVTADGVKRLQQTLGGATIAWDGDDAGLEAVD
jgi:hypothetical protein